MFFLSGLYPWIKALHLISVISWMAAMLYLPRLFVYHCQVEVGSAQSELFKIMERRLLRAIMTPAMILSFFFGGLLFLVPGVVSGNQGWIHAKLTCVAAMLAMHGFLALWRRHFAMDHNRHSGRFYRIINEVPTILMVSIVILAVVKPF